MNRSFARVCQDAARAHAEQVLVYARDPLGTGTPLFCDGLEVETLKPARWHAEGQEWVLSNLASQQHLLRLLESLTRVTGREHFQEAAEQAVRHTLEHCRVGWCPSWGGHMAWDLATQAPVYASNKGQMHELKRHYPAYGLFFRVDPVRTTQLIQSFWQAHILDWSSLEFSRHGLAGAETATDAVWDHTWDERPVFFEGKGLTFCNAGSDLYYAAAHLAHQSEDVRPLDWARRLSQRYHQTRHPKTGLTGYQFSLSILPEGTPHVPLGRGDRAREQVGMQLEPYAPTEATLVTAKQLRTLLGPVACCRLGLAELLGEQGHEFLWAAHAELIAWATHALDVERGLWRPMLTCGLDLSQTVLQKSGYYGPGGSCLPSLKPDGLQLLSYARAFRLTQDELVWRILGHLLPVLGLGTISGAVFLPRLETGASDAASLAAVVELYQATGQQAFLEVGCRMGENILKTRRRGDLFVGHGLGRCARVDRPEPLALLLLAEALLDQAGRLEPFSPGLPHFEANHDDAGETSDEKYLYERLVQARMPVQEAVALSSGVL